MALIFINFRNGDGQWAAKLLKNTLTQRFGPDSVFLSSDSIRLAAKSSDALLEAARDCDVLLVLVGPQWLTITDGTGQRRLFNSDDWVRREISTALTSGRKVATVLLNDTPQLTADQLPADIRELADRQGVRLSRRRFDTDVEDLGKSLMEIVPRLRPAKAPPGVNVDMKLVVGTSVGSEIVMADIAESSYPVTIKGDARINEARETKFTGARTGTRRGKGQRAPE
jgi:TIR domain